MKISIDNFMCIFEEADTFSMRSVDFSLSNVDDLTILEEFGSVEGRFSSQDEWRTVFDYK